eukprot:CAMPEP_0198500590 /NCGR_PEP_ID=MMETSP1462-20131121/8241_1 /TAXON_ID=1333877 /ORGANISM="Brandtodinium nutriculum, Strain RCC3387" /LENGTH=255 /DNA_ID=CAMNT_0044229601 /DNA_START=132 /DNA_END=898 /DNA_ORIENTATION=-
MRLRSGGQQSVLPQQAQPGTPSVRPPKQGQTVAEVQQQSLLVAEANGLVLGTSLGGENFRAPAQALRGRHDARVATTAHAATSAQAVVEQEGVPQGLRAWVVRDLRRRVVAATEVATREHRGAVTLAASRRARAVRDAAANLLKVEATTGIAARALRVAVALDATDLAILGEKRGARRHAASTAKKRRRQEPKRAPVRLGDLDVALVFANGQEPGHACLRGGLHHHDLVPDDYSLRHGASRQATRGKARRRALGL